MTKTLLNGLAIGESPRWHDGRLWFSNWGAQEIIAADLAGQAEVMAHVPTTLPFSIDWLHSGELLVVSGQEGQLLRQDPTTHELRPIADLTAAGPAPWNEITADARGVVYVNSICFKFGEQEFRPGIIACITPGGQVRQVADGLAFPNGMVITPDNSTLIVAESFAGRFTAFDIDSDGGLSHRRVWADFGAPGTGDGICMDAEGALWTTSLQGGVPACLRVREGGEVLDRIPLELFGFACMLGGDDGRTLCVMEADWRGPEQIMALVRERTGKINMYRAPSPHAGRP